MLRLRVAAYNIHKGVTGIARRMHMHDVRQGLHNMDADTVLLQEVQDCNGRLVTAELFDPNYTQLRYLTTDVYPHTVYGRNAVYEHGHHGNAILLRFPILLSENLDISDHCFEQRGLLHAVTDLGFGEVHPLCAHFGLFARNRQRQAEALVDCVRSVVPPDTPLVVAGDFNDWNDRFDRTIRQALGTTEVADKAANARPVRTFLSHMPWLRLDRIYVRGFDIERAHTLTGREWAQRSDHVPLLAELTHP